MPRIPIPPELGAVFSVNQARNFRLGLTRLRGPDLERPFWGVRATSGTVSDVTQLARAYATRMPPHAFFSHTTAARLWGIPLPTHVSANLPLHVSVTDPHRAPSGRDVVGHRLRTNRQQLTILAGLRLTTLERTVMDLGWMLDDENYLAVVDNALWWRRPQRATKHSIEHALRHYGGSRGLPRVRRILPVASERSDSRPESIFRFRFIRAGFDEVEANQNILDNQGNFIAMVDLQIRRYRLAFDYEGDHHRTDARQWRKDLQRVPRLQDVGWHHTRISADDLADSTELLTRTARLLRARGWPG